jgi:excisionase family DNA binding protein
LPQAKTPRADEKRAYRIPEFCWRYGVGRSTAYKLAKEGRLRLVKIGNRTLILHEDAEALLQGPSDPMAAPPEENPPDGTGRLGMLFPDRNDFLSTTATAAAQAVIGIDPGIGGALALVSRTGELIKVADMPVLRDGSAGRASVNAHLLVELLARWHAGEVICEFVTTRPGEGPTGAFSFGRCRKLERGAELHPALEKYAGLPADFIRAHGGDRLPEPRLVAGGHFRGCSNTREALQPDSTAAE